MAEQESDQAGLGGQARALKEEFAPAHIEAELERVARERPMLRHLVAFDVVLKALVAAAVVALLLMLVASARLAAVGLLVVFFGMWFGLARVRYDRRRDTGDPGESEPE